MSLLEALLNTLWQSAAVTFVVWASLRRATRVNAATREAIWWAVLGFLVLLPLLRQVAVQPASVRAARATAVYAPAAPLDDAAPGRWVPPSPAPRPATPVIVHSRRGPTLGFALWGLFTLAGCLRLLWSFVHLRRLKRSAHPASPAPQAVFDSWIAACGISRPARLLVSADIPVPVAAGFRHPAVLLPEGLLANLSPAELDHVLLHELAHLARRDDWSNLASRAAAAFIGIHPVAAWVLRQISRERELACDDWVVSATGAPRPYAESLARLFELCIARPRLRLAPGIADGGSELGDRIAMLLRRGRDFRTRASALRVFACAAVMLVAVVAASRTPAWIALAAAPQPLPPTRASAAFFRSHPITTFARRPNFLRSTQSAHPLLSGASLPHTSLLAALVATGYGDLSVDDIILLKSRGITPEFLDAMNRTGWAKRTTSELIEIRARGVQPEYIGEILGLGFGPFSAADFAALRARGVPIELFHALKESGFTRANANEIIDAHARGLAAGHLREARQYGPKLSLAQIIRLRQAGVL